MDVEWAHSVAPDANILLVEAASMNTSDLMTAVTRRPVGLEVSNAGGEQLASVRRHRSNLR